MKICHVITRMIVGGAQENTLLTIRGHQAKGHEVTLVSGPSPGREGKLLEETGLPDFPLHECPHLVREISPFHDLAAYFALKKFFRENHFDVVHTHSSKAGIIGRLAARAAGVPVVVHTVHGQAFHPYQSCWKNRLYIFLEHWAATKCDRIFAVAQAMIDQCVAARVAPREKYQVVYSGMDTAGFAETKRDPELRKALGIPENALLISTVARLFPQKGYEFVIPGAEMLLKKRNDLHFLLIGDGPLYHSLQQELQQKGIDSAFHFAGLVPPQEVRRYLVQSDLLWHFSLHEGLPRAVVQALAVGIPAVGFDLDGTPEVIRNGETGYVVPATAVDEAVEVTEKLLDDPALRRDMGKTGQARVLRQFDWQRMADILEKEYKNLLKNIGEQENDDRKNH